MPAAPRACGTFMLLLALCVVQPSKLHAAGGPLAADPSLNPSQFHKGVADPTIPSSMPARVTTGIEQSAVIEACTGTLGTWCSAASAQTPQPFKPPPRGDKDCPDNCQDIGNCNHATGLCMCPAGYTGPNCGTSQKRPCTDHTRLNTERGYKNIVRSNVDEIGLDLDVTKNGWTASRCAGDRTCLHSRELAVMRR